MTFGEIMLIVLGMVIGGVPTAVYYNNVHTKKTDDLIAEVKALSAKISGTATAVVTDIKKV